MFLKELKIQAFRHLVEQACCFSKVNLIFGPNGGGKSSLLGAIEWLYTGFSRWQNDKGAGVERIIPYGAPGIRVRANTENGGFILRELLNGDHTLQFNDVQGNKSLQQEILYEAMGGVKRSSVALCCRPMLFFGLSPDDQKATLFSLLGGNLFNAQAIQAELNKWDHKLVGLGESEEVRAVFAAVTAAKNTNKKTGLEKEARDLRAAAKKKLDMLKAELNGLQAQTVSAPENLSALMFAADQDVLELQDKKAAADSLGGKRGALESEAASLRLKIKNAESDLKDLQTQLETAQVNAEKYDAITAEMAIIQGEINEREAKAKTAFAGVQVFYSELAEELLVKGSCPIVKAACPMDIGERKEKIVKLQKANDKAAGEGARLELEISTRKTHLEEKESLRKPWAKAAQQIEILQAQIKAANFADYEARLRQIEAELANADESSFDEEAYKAAQQKAKDLYAIQERVTAQAENAKKAVNKQQEITRQEHSVRIWEALVSAFRPEGIQARILTEKKAQVEELLNGVLSAWNWQAEIDPENQGIYLICGKQRTPWETLSTSEQLRLGVAIQAAVAVRENVRFLMVDDAEHLGPQERRELIMGLLALVNAGQLDQVFVSSVLTTAGPDGSPVLPKAPTVPGMAAFVVVGGMITKLEAPVPSPQVPPSPPESPLELNAAGKAA